MRKGLIAAVVIFVADQLSKFLVRDVLLDGQSIVVVYDFFNVVTAWNTGVSFSMFDNHGILGIVLLSALSIMIVAYLLYWMSREKNVFLQVALGFVVGGALGNVIDRMCFGAVFDFLDFHIGSGHWPAFNIADSFICIGAVMIIAESLFHKYEKKEGKDA